MRVKPYIRYASRTKMCYDAVDRTFCDAINYQIKSLIRSIISW